MSQAETNDTTPESVSDRQLAEAYRELESAVSDLKNMALVMETVAQDAIGTRDGWCEKRIKAAMPEMGGYRIYILNEDQADGLDYALNHFTSLARELHQAYFGALEGRQRKACG